MTRLQNLGFKGIAKGYATDAVNGKLGNIKNNQVQNRVKQIEAMTRLQNLETVQCPEGQHYSSDPIPACYINGAKPYKCDLDNNICYPQLQNLYLDAFWGLQNLSETQGTNIKEFEAKAGSQTMFDFNNGDPLANTDVTDMHMQKGAAIDFDGASGKQEVAVLGKF